MRFLLPIKRVVDYNVVVQVNQDGSGVQTEHAPHSINPFDAIAIEAALQYKEQHPDAELTALSIGCQKSQEICRQALAMGVDRAILVHTPATLAPLTIAKILQHFCQQLSPDIVLMGKQAIDYDHNQTGQMLAALLDWPQGCFISSLQYKDNTLIIEREIDSGIESLQLTMPCILTTDLRLNEPRFAKLPDIIRAKNKPLDIIEIDTLPIDITTEHQTILSYHAPPSRPAGQTLESIDELMTVLQSHEVIP